MQTLQTVDHYQQWLDHYRKWRGCTKCPLHKQRTRIVLARAANGFPADLLFVGEAPGQNEDTIGQPFMGPAGQLLDQIVERAVPVTMTTAYTNLCACLPREAKKTNDHRPEKAEIEACRPRLDEMLEICCPRLVVCVGKLAADWLNEDMERAGTKYVNIEHPAFILAHMPMAQKGFATMKCIIKIRNAIEDLG